MEENLSKKSKAELVELAQSLDVKVADLQGKNSELQKLLAAAIETAEEKTKLLNAATAAADEREKMLEDAKANAVVVTGSTPALEALLAKAKGAIAELREIISLSCKDHCPHHQKPGACVNCGIKKRLDAVVED